MAHQKIEQGTLIFINHRYTKSEERPSAEAILRPTGPRSQRAKGVRVKRDTSQTTHMLEDSEEHKVMKIVLVVLILRVIIPKSNNANNHVIVISIVISCKKSSNKPTVAFRSPK